jgi:hypothetical protein
VRLVSDYPEVRVELARVLVRDLEQQVLESEQELARLKVMKVQALALLGLLERGL